MAKALFLNGVYGDLLDQIVEVQSGDNALTCYLQPYSSSKILLLSESSPSIDNPVRIYISTTSMLNTVLYTGLVVGWENKQKMSKDRKDLLDQHFKDYQSMDPGIYLEYAEGKPCVNLIAVHALKKYSNPFPTSALRLYDGGNRLKPRTRAGNWAYVHEAEDWLGVSQVVFETHENEALEKDISKSVLQSSEERRKRLKTAETKPKVLQVVSKGFSRNPDVIAEVQYRAKGVCECCQKAAPFISQSRGRPFLEIHHIIALADGGKDCVENSAALCPNCHREAHLGQEKDKILSLLQGKFSTSRAKTC